MAKLLNSFTTSEAAFIVRHLSSYALDTEGNGVMGGIPSGKDCLTAFPFSTWRGSRKALLRKLDRKNMYVVRAMFKVVEGLTRGNLVVKLRPSSNRDAKYSRFKSASMFVRVPGSAVFNANPSYPLTFKAGAMGSPGHPFPLYGDREERLITPAQLRVKVLDVFHRRYGVGEPLGTKGSVRVAAAAIANVVRVSGVFPVVVSVVTDLVKKERARIQKQLDAKPKKKSK